MIAKGKSENKYTFDNIFGFPRLIKDEKSIQKEETKWTCIFDKFDFGEQEESTQAADLAD